MMSIEVGPVLIFVTVSPRLYVCCRIAVDCIIAIILGSFSAHLAYVHCRVLVRSGQVTENPV